MSTSGFEVGSQFWSGTLFASFYARQGSKQGSGLHFLFFFSLNLPGGLLVLSAFSSCLLGLAKQRVLLNARPSSFSEMCLRALAPSHQGTNLLLLCSSAAPRSESLASVRRASAYLTRHGATQEPPDHKAKLEVVITHILCRSEERGPETQAHQWLDKPDNILRARF